MERGEGGNSRFDGVGCIEGSDVFWRMKTGKGFCKMDQWALDGLSLMQRFMGYEV